MSAETSTKKVPESKLTSPFAESVVNAPVPGFPAPIFVESILPPFISALVIVILAIVPPSTLSPDI